MKKIEITETEKASLQSLKQKQKIESRLKTRAMIILLAAEGATYDQIMYQTQQSRRSVAKWITRFRAERIKGLVDKSRTGAPRIITPEQEAKIVEKACSKQTDGYSTWSQRRIAAEIGVSQSSVSNILRKADLKPHKTDYWCGKSPDPNFDEKMTQIIGLYMNPPENALVLCVDEKTQIQALSRTQEPLPMKTGQPKRFTATYKRNGVVSLLAALSVHKGEITAKAIEANTSENFLDFLKSLAKKYKKKHLHIIVDNLAVHKHSIINQWLEKNKRVTMHFTPTYASWLNQIEIWFGFLAKDVLKGGVWESKEQLVNQIMNYIVTYNATRAVPFKWTYTGKVLQA